MLRVGDNLIGHIFELLFDTYANSQNLDQLLGIARLANQIWTHYHQIVGIPLSGYNFYEKLQSWWPRSSLCNAMGTIGFMLPCLLCLDICKERDRKISEGTCFVLKQIKSFRYFHKQNAENF